MTSALLSWIESPRANRGLRFLEDSGEWRFYSFEALRDRALGLAARIHSSRVSASDVVCILLPTGPELFSAIYATWFVGGTICPLVPPVMFEDENIYSDHVSRIIQAASPQAIVTDPSYSDLVRRVLTSAGRVNTVVIDAHDESGSGVTSLQRAGDVALLQFTSGSSGTPRGVRVSFENLRSNIDAIRQWIRMGSDDATGTWLPLYHDMGLIGCMLTPTTNQSDVWIMRPDQFVRNPLKWLECFGKENATLCASPNFGYGFAARRVEPNDLQGMDFSNWRVAIAGAEPVDAQALTSFCDLLSPLGFSSCAFLPAYGLAEATLAVTGGSPGEPARAVKLEWDSIAFGAPVEIANIGNLDDLALETSEGWLVSSGKPHPDIAVRVVDAKGVNLPEDVLGEIVVVGPCVARGYTDTRSEGATRFSAEGIMTGDAGFLHGGELFVVGRIADSLKVRGRTVYADDLEARVSSSTNIRRSRLVVVAIPGEQGGAVLAIAEDADQTWAIEAGRILRGAVGDSIKITVAVGGRGTILRTSSGKPRRRLMWELAEAGKLVFRWVIHA